ncbi:MAG: hypothetical protein IJ009_02355 [Clostridia bacterium]|nr:hypothetical protein [Clostridia bacterium]
MEKMSEAAMHRLFSAVLCLQSEEECAAFFEDICTMREVQDLSQRLEVARLLHEGKNYLEVSRETGASTATICRVNKCLHHGSGGYRAVLARAATEGGEEA